MIEGAFRVLEDLDAVDASAEGMKALTLRPEEETAFATAALALRYGERTEGQPVAVGTRIAPRPPHRSVRAELPHTAPALSHDAKRSLGYG